MDLQLNGKRAIVTGGSRGIGFAVAQALVAEGVDVALVARDQDALDVAAARFGASARVLPVAADTTDDNTVRAMVERVVATFGGVDILVNAAAQAARPGAPRTLDSLVDDDLRREIETKVLGYLRCARAVAPHMTTQGWGRIINVAGLAARQTGSVFGTIRNVSVAAMSKNLADELGRSGVNVTTVHPGTTVTEAMPAIVAGLAQAQGVSEAEAQARLAANVSIGRLITAAEVADVVTFLASPRSVAITGDAVVAGGGDRGPVFY